MVVGEVVVVVVVVVRGVVVVAAAAVVVAVVVVVVAVVVVVGLRAAATIWPFQAWRRLFCSQRMELSATRSAADHSSVPASCFFSFSNLSAVQFALDNSRSNRRRALRASLSVTPLPMKRFSRRCSRPNVFRFSSPASQVSGRMAPVSAAMRNKSSEISFSFLSRTSCVTFLGCATRTWSTQVKLPKGLPKRVTGLSLYSGGHCAASQKALQHCLRSVKAQNFSRLPRYW